MFQAEHSRITRRELIKIVGVAAAGLSAGAALAACGGTSSAPAAGSGPATASPNAASQAAAPASGAPAAKPSAAAGDNYKVPATWDALLAAAKAEGKVVVASSPNTETRTKLPAAFKDRFGIEMEYLPGATEVTARLQAERAAGQYTLDAEVNGSDSIYATLLENGWLDPLKPALLLPDAADASKWTTGGPWFRDPKGDTVLQLINSVSANVTINADVVSPNEITTADSLLDPKWKDKICAFDPGANGPGLAIGCALYVAKGPDYVTKLYKGQNAVLSRDYKQTADWVAHGGYPIGLAITDFYLTEYRKGGVKFAQLDLPDAPNSTNGAFGMLVVLNKAPHPNAARVFANWMASKEGMALFSQTELGVPVRNDIDATWLSDSLKPKPGVKYLDTYEYNFETGQRLQIRDFYQKLLK